MNADPESRSRHLSWKLSSKLAVTYLWQGNKNETIIQLQVSDLEISTWYGRKAPTNGQPDLGQVKEPFLLVLSDKEAEIYSTCKDENALNFQRGLASLFIYKQENGDFNEADVMGQCRSSYSQDHHGLHKVRENCAPLPDADQSLFSNRHYATVKSLYKILDDGIISQIEVREWLELYPHLTPEMGQDVQQRQTLILRGKFDI